MTKITDEEAIAAGAEPEDTDSLHAARLQEEKAQLLERDLVTARIDVQNRTQCLQRAVRVLQTFKSNAELAQAKAADVEKMLSERAIDAGDEYTEGTSWKELGLKHAAAAEAWTKAAQLLREALQAYV